jgi:hypothetical protein
VLRRGSISYALRPLKATGTRTKSRSSGSFVLPPSPYPGNTNTMDNSNSYYPPTYFPGHMQPPSQTPSGPSHLSGSHSNSHPHPHPHAQTHAQSYASYPGSAEQSRQSTAAPSPSSSGSSQSPSASASASHAYPQAEAQGSGSGSQSHGPLVEPHQDLNDFLESFWTRQVDNVEREEPDFKNYPLPLARIKKVMKSDEDVKVSRAGSNRIVASSRLAAL